MRGRDRKGRHERDDVWALTRDRIVRAAVDLARSEGADAVSMRRVADVLRVGAMSLYWHVPNKHDLIHAMQELVFGEMGLEGHPSGDWRGDLTRIATATRSVLERNPWMRAYADDRPRQSPVLMHHAEFSLAAVDGLGLTLPEMFTIVTAVDDYVIGFVLRRELREPTGDEPPLDDIWDTEVFRNALASGQFPTFERYAGQSWHVSPDDRFTFGLTCLLDGIERFIDRRRADPPTSHD